MGENAAVRQGLVGSMGHHGRLYGVVRALETSQGRAEPFRAMRKPCLDLEPQGWHPQGEGGARPQVIMQPGGEGDSIASRQG